MARCRCTDINNGTNDLIKLKDAEDHLKKARQESIYATSAMLEKLAGRILNGATPNNAFIFQQIESKLEQPLNERILAALNKCKNKIDSLPAQIQAWRREDNNYHEEMAAKSGFYSNPK